jgi:hypothetical protein
VQFFHDPIAPLAAKSFARQIPPAANQRGNGKDNQKP